VRSESTTGAALALVLVLTASGALAAPQALQEIRVYPGHDSDFVLNDDDGVTGSGRAALRNIRRGHNSLYSLRPASR
jgi:hypothetical protein